MNSICGKCGEATLFDDACLFASWNDLSNASVMALTPEPMNDAVMIDSLEGTSPRARWKWYHDSCMSEEDDNSYWISGKRISTKEKALAWTFHLMRKPGWVTHSNWDQLVCRIHNISRGL